MKRLIFISALCFLLTACDRSAPDAVEAVAKCVETSTDAGEREDLGRRVDMAKEGYPVHLARFDQLSCRGAKGLLDNNATMDAQGLAISTRLLPSKDFRRGLQTSVWLRAGRTPEVAGGLASLVLQEGSNTVIRAWGRACQRLTEDMAAVLRDMETPYLTAYVGTRGWVADAKQAHDLASDIGDQAKRHALFEANVAAAACDDPGLTAQLEQHVNAMKSFGAGTNPLVPGCKVVPENNEFVLRCGAPGQ